eukprot:6022900-Prymnesium_polylepis.1
MCANAQSKRIDIHGRIRTAAGLLKVGPATTSISVPVPCHVFPLNRQSIQWPVIHDAECAQRMPSTHAASASAHATAAPHAKRKIGSSTSACVRT